MKPHNVPAHAEALAVMDHLVLKRTPSKLIPGAEQMATIVKCPRCERERPLSDTLRFNCAGCGLAMHVGATQLFVWEEEVADA